MYFSHSLHNSSHCYLEYKLKHFKPLHCLHDKTRQIHFTQSIQMYGNMRTMVQLMIRGYITFNTFCFITSFTKYATRSKITIKSFNNQSQHITVTQTYIKNLFTKRLLCITTSTIAMFRNLVMVKVLLFTCAAQTIFHIQLG